MEKNNPHIDSSTLSKKLSSMTQDEFLDLGHDGMSYIKRIEHNDEGVLYALHAANGHHIATGQNMDHIQKIAFEHHLVPLSIQ